MAPPIFCYLPLTSNPEIPEKKTVAQINLEDSALRQG